MGFPDQVTDHFFLNSLNPFLQGFVGLSDQVADHFFLNFAEFVFTGSHEIF